MDNLKAMMNSLVFDIIKKDEFLYLARRGKVVPISVFSI